MADDNDQNFDQGDETLDAAQSLDQDETGYTDGQAPDAPEGWAGADKFGTTAAEEREGESLDDKLAEERPETPVEDNEDRPVGATPIDELDESVDEVVDDEAGEVAAGEDEVVGPDGDPDDTDPDAGAPLVAD